MFRTPNINKLKLVFKEKRYSQLLCCLLLRLISPFCLRINKSQREKYRNISITNKFQNLEIYLIIPLLHAHHNYYYYIALSYTAQRVLQWNCNSTICYLCTFEDLDHESEKVKFSKKDGAIDFFGLFLRMLFGMTGKT